MTELEWQTTNDLRRMLDILGEDRAFRKVMLFSVACCHRISHLFRHELSYDLVRFAEQWADGAPDNREVWADSEGGAAALGVHPNITADVVARVLAIPIVALIRDPVQRAWLVSSYAATSAEVDITPQESLDQANALAEDERSQRRLMEYKAQASLLRDIFGNPFRPVAFSPEWRTSTATAIAQQMYESRDFGAMPILADALQDAGCDNADILNHCRGPGPHVRGCWVVDLVLGKS